MKDIEDIKIECAIAVYAQLVLQKPTDTIAGMTTQAWLKATPKEREQKRELEKELRVTRAFQEAAVFVKHYKTYIGHGAK